MSRDAFRRFLLLEQGVDDAAEAEREWRRVAAIVDDHRRDEQAADAMLQASEIKISP